MRPEKQLLLNEIKTHLDRSTALMLMRYQKMDPNKSSELRMKLAQSGGTLEIVRKTILVKAAQDSGIAMDLNALQGHIGVVFIKEDAIGVAKGVYGFAQENEEMLEVIGGQFEGKSCSAKEFEMISKLPSKDEMRAQLLSIFVAPMAQTLSVMEALLESKGQSVDNESSTNS